jgi:hypothetical protein
MVLVLISWFANRKTTAASSDGWSVIQNQRWNWLA